MTNLSHKDINFTEEEFQKHEGKFDISNSARAFVIEVRLYQNILTKHSGFFFSPITKQACSFFFSSFNLNRKFLNKGLHWRHKRQEQEGKKPEQLSLAEKHV